MGDVTVNNERLATLESDMKHTQEDVHEIKRDIKEFKDINKNIEIAVVKLAQIADTNQRIYPRLENLEAKVDKNTIRLATWAGGLSVVSIIFGVLFKHLLS